MNNSNYTELMKTISKYLPKKDLKLVEDAYLLASKKHEGQFRKSGEDYINHPLEVALILTTINADSETLAAALLHDVVEDTDITKEEIKDKFGEVVANLVDGVTKINSINVSTDNEYLTNYYKKIIVGMSEDVRVIIIKLADRLHNMRTLYAIPVEKQKEKAKETLEILAPIAHRLGMHKIKSELEDLSLKYLKPDVYYNIVEQLNNTKLEREQYVNKMMEEVSTLLNKNGIKHEIKGRAKSIYSIYKKLDKGRSFNDIFDLLAMRILVKKEQECYLSLGLIHSKYRPIPKRFKDYIAMPKTNLYQTLHTTVFGLDGYLFEIQIRTYDMDEIAENGIASHWAYKEHKNAALEMQNITEQKLQFYKTIIELNEDKMSNEDFVNSVKDEVLNNNIYVFTPKGDVIELSKGDTPIDFAYKVHSEVGDKTTGAIVNNVMVPLTYELKNNDIVRVITNKNSTGPSREWLNIVKSTQAKNKIKAFFNRTNKEEYINTGKELLEKELRRNKLVISDFYKSEELQKLLVELKLNNLEDLYLNIGNNKYSANLIINKTKITDPIEEVKEIKEVKPINNSSDIYVGTATDIKTHIANCCYPIPGDDIIGFITKGSGISIHRKNCGNINHENERTVDVSWNENINNRYNCELIVYTTTDDNLVLELVQAALNTTNQIESVNIINKGDNNVYSVMILTNNIESLEKYIQATRKIKKVSLVERVMQ